VIELLKKTPRKYLRRAASLNFNVETLLSNVFADFAAKLDPATKKNIVIEIQVADIFTNMRAFQAAREIVQSHGFRLCLDGMDALSFRQLDRNSLGFDLAKMFWNADLKIDSKSDENQKLQTAINETALSTRMPTSKISMQPVSIILHSPQMGENIGAAARAMLNFGYEDLRIISPRDGWPNAKALEMAAHAKAVVENAKIYQSTEDAIADLDYVYATTARNRDMDKQAVAPAQIELVSKTGFMFGPERSGLENKDISLANKIIAIPVSEKCPSLNLAQAVGIICYELSRSNSAESVERELASKQEFLSLVSHLEQELASRSFFQDPAKKANMLLNIQNMLMRAEMSPQEVRTMRGIIRCLSEK
jgi:tRNA/rRNA methyltransferase